MLTKTLNSHSIPFLVLNVCVSTGTGASHAQEADQTHIHAKYAFCGTMIMFTGQPNNKQGANPAWFATSKPTIRITV